MSATITPGAIAEAYAAWETDENETRATETLAAYAARISAAIYDDTDAYISPRAIAADARYLSDYERTLLGWDTDENDAPSNYLTDETRDEMGAAMDAENATRFAIRHAIIGNNVAQYEVFDANLSNSVAVATFWEFPGIDVEWPSAREMAETFVSAWNAK